MQQSLLANIIILATLVVGLLTLILVFLGWWADRKEWRQPPLITNGDRTLPVAFRGRNPYGAELLVVNKTPGQIEISVGTSIHISHAKPIRLRTPDDKIVEQKEEGEHSLSDISSFEVTGGQKGKTLFVAPYESLRAKMEMHTTVGTYFDSGACEGALNFNFSSARYRGEVEVSVRFLSP